ncbi:MAG: flagellar hook-length control protein FliK [Bdellovibrionota bacterium]
MTESTQQEVQQKLFTQAEKGDVTLPTNFQEVKGEEAELLRDFSGAVQRTVAHQQAQPQEVDQLARIVEGLLQGKLSESSVPQSSVTAPVMKEQSDLFSSLIQARVLSGANEGALSKSLEQVSGLLKAGSQQSNNQTFHQQGNEQLSLARQKSAESTSAMNKEAFKELSKGQELRTLKKVEEALKEVAKSRDGKTISLRLDPPSLGSVRVEVSIRDGVLHARLAADSVHVNTLLRDKGAELQQVLRGLGIDVNGVNVSVQDDGRQSQQDSNMFSQQDGHFEGGPRDEASFKASSAVTVGAGPKGSPLTDHWVA